MTKAAFNALITEFSIDTDHFPGTDLVQKEGRVGLAIISDPAGDLWHLFIDNKPVKVQIVDKESSFDFTERKVERLRDFDIRLVSGSFQCTVSVEYKINGEFHHSRKHTYHNIRLKTIERLYDPEKAKDLFDTQFGFSIKSKTSRTDLPTMRKQFDKEKVYSLLESIVRHRFLAGSCQAHKKNSSSSKHYETADEAFAELLTLLGMEDDNGTTS